MTQSITEPQTNYSYTIREPLLCDAIYYISSTTPLTNEELVKEMSNTYSTDVDYENSDTTRDIEVSCVCDTPEEGTPTTNVYTIPHV